MPDRSHKQTGRLSDRNQGGHLLDTTKNLGWNRNTLAFKLNDL